MTETNLEKEESRDGLDVKRLGDIRLLLSFDVQEQYARVFLRKILDDLFIIKRSNETKRNEAERSGARLSQLLDRRIASR
jgi:hypothetical protein